MNEHTHRAAVCHHAFSILRSWLHGTPLAADSTAFCTEENLKDIYTLLKKYDLAHLAASVLESADLPLSKTVQLFSVSKMQAIYRCARMELEYENICNIFEQARIPFLPLKGAVLREYYPEPWMRTSCDIDILVPEDLLEKAAAALVSHGWTLREKKQYHDISLYSPSGVHLELHYHIKMRMPNADPILETVWDHCTPVSGKQYAHCQSNAFVLFHHLAHMACHMLIGGCGIRPFLDLWLMMRHMHYDPSTLKTLCSSAQLDTFYQTAAELSHVWFDGQTHSRLTKQLESYILTGNAYGSRSQLILFSQATIGSRWKYLLHRIFVPYRTLMAQYPIARKHKWLIPLLPVIRWSHLLSPKRIRASLREFHQVRQLSRQDLSRTEDFLICLGLKEPPSR